MTRVVYRREKVARDEREYAEKQKRERDLVLDREQDDRLAALRAKKQRRGWACLFTTIRELSSSLINRRVAIGSKALMPEK